MNHTIPAHGFSVLPGLLGEEECQALVSELGPVAGAGKRGILGHPVVAALARSSRLLEVVQPCLTGAARAVRALFFDKSPHANWLVPWHQDLTLAAKSRAEVAGFGPWSLKEGIPHVQPPVRLLERMVTVRIHLDSADASNGALRVLAGSHCQGRLGAERIQELRGFLPEFLCVSPVGGALLMRPLLLHASGRSVSPCHRRVLHMEYADYDLPDGLEWHDSA